MQHINRPRLDPFYQIMRQRLLADRMVQQRESDVDEAKVVVVVPEDNRAYRTVGHSRTVTSPPLARRLPHRGNGRSSHAGFPQGPRRAVRHGGPVAASRRGGGANRTVDDGWIFPSTPE